MNKKIKVFLVMVMLFMFSVNHSAYADNTNIKKELSNDLSDLKTSVEESYQIFDDNKQLKYLTEDVFKSIDKDIESLSKEKRDEEELSKSVLKTNLKVLKLKDLLEWYTLDKSENLPYIKEIKDLEKINANEDYEDSERVEKIKEALLSMEEIVKEEEKKAEIKDSLSYKQEFEKMELSLLINSKELSYNDALDYTRKVLHEQKALNKNFMIINNEFYKGIDQFFWPVKQDFITSPFGSRTHPIKGAVINHNGVDVRASTGTSIYAANDGVVEFSGDKGGYGKTVIIDHQNGYKTLYAHNSELVVKQGQSVKLGETISKAGSTGASTGPHLHFEIIKNGEKINPMNFFTK